MPLFHYCNSHAFWSIISNRSIWLSDLSASNDSEEGRWMTRLLMSLASKSPQEHSIWPTIALQVDAISSKFQTFGFCLSDQGDMLSQWRGYADDAAGFSIGFNEDYFSRMGYMSEHGVAKIEKVLYSSDQHIELIRERLASLNWKHLAFDLDTIDAVERAIIESIGGDVSSASPISIMLHDVPYLIKNPAFSEERESRLILRSDLSNPGTQFRSRGSAIVAYRPLTLTDIVPQPICKVCIGPKNHTSQALVEAFLSKHGFGGVEVVKSAATYR
ncbi:hypothetical protein J2045_000003 [Peteryoungia aggregata LMG 23059]|uniref:DUF2971 domain-containing protein n=1 Tax=Peteryoungia aggregata LMG 23059 TaxID=1368425 RepID=A0ABU0G168_9HYPH|nr:DUF2971 domain-containing protein [Peteryoungia aggregata]MDQ0418993.1 hypothetical protein [Peteryoungia aggregata LMG 23059]